MVERVQDNGALTVIVRDDGVGGACVECGEDQATGLGGLKDRVEALGGVLEVDSPRARGRCSLRPSPCASRRRSFTAPSQCLRSLPRCAAGPFASCWCCGALAALALPSTGSVRDVSGVRRLPSLEPEKTQALWKELTTRRVEFRPLEAQACRPLRGIFYASGDWLRLATTLAAKASPCAQYYISVPPVVADKTRQRPGQAQRIRALGPAFHALAEIHLTTWQKWVANTGSTWYQAGVDARRKMAAAGFDVTAGDSWAINEVTSAMRRGDGSSRANLREFLRGLYDAGGEGPPRRASLGRRDRPTRARGRGPTRPVPRSGSRIRRSGRT